MLVMTECESDGRLGAAWPALADALARLHAPCERDYGWDVDYAFGSVAIVNARSRDWASFWADRSEEHTSELQSLMRISYAVFCLKKKITVHDHHTSNLGLYHNPSNP